MKTSEQSFKPAGTGRDWLLSKFDSFEKSLNGEASSRLHAIRKTAIARFAALGFPTTRDEEWKYTDVSPLSAQKFTPVLGNGIDSARTNDILPFTFDNLPCHRLSFVDGHFSSALSSAGLLPAGVSLESLAAAIARNDERVERHLTRYAQFETNAFTALSTAFLRDGAFVNLAEGTVVDLPIHLLFVSTGREANSALSPRNLIVAGRNSQAAIIESHVSLCDSVYFNNTVSEFVLGENAVLEHDRLQMESTKAFHIATTHVHQERSSNFTSNSISLSASLIRNTIEVVLDGEGAEATLNGLYLGTGNQHIDNHTTIEHAKPHCPSHELYKGILSGSARGVFNGKIKVHKDAQKTDAKQTNKNLILSDGASVDTKPQLEIFANDVKCTHGATIGQLDEEAMFYLRSRGVDVGAARDMLIYAFASDVIDRIHVEPLRDMLHGMIHARLEEDRSR